VVEICRNENVNGIIASFSDILFEYLVKIADQAGLKTYCLPETSVFLRSKKQMCRMFEELGVPHPKYHVLEAGFSEEDVKDITFPAVMKPVNGYGSRGIFVVENVQEVKKRFQETVRYSIRSQQIMLEEYNDGYEFNMMNWIMDGEVYTLSVADREKSVEIQGDIPHVSRIVYPSRRMDSVYDEAREIVRKVAEYVGIHTGPLCMQFFYQPGKGIQVCECAGRFFGYEHELLTYSSGFSIEDLLLDYVYDEKAMKERIKKHSAFLPHITAGLYFHGHDGIVGDTEEIKTYMEKLDCLEYMLYYEKGDHISHETGAKPYLLRIYMKADSYQELDGTCRNLFSSVKVLDANGKSLVYHNEIPAPKKE
jgi:biotin carboxylase